MTTSAFMRGCIDQPTTCLSEQVDDGRKVAPPSAVARYLMSVVQTRFGALAMKLRSSRFGATGKSWSQFVGAMYLRLWRARMSCCAISLLCESTPCPRARLV